jgi:glucosamine--fructose-6-phosphate aminotransferase (isomerizing)
MCGIIGVLMNTPAAPAMIDALKRLEYRGYDSAGVAVLEGGALKRRRASGKIANLETELAEAPLKGPAGIGHTRWATHGPPTELNAHPHATAHVAIVHNGIIENFRDLREELLAAGRRFESDTDTEVIVHLVSAGLEAGQSPYEAVRDGLARLRGAFAIACLFTGHDDLMIGARAGSPLVIGVGAGEMYLGSDALAVAPLTRQVVYLDEGDVAILSRTSWAVRDAAGHPAERTVVLAPVGVAAVEKGNHRHFMHKEILEQPDSVGRTIAHYIDPLGQRPAVGELAGLDLSAVTGVRIVGCGTAYYAGRVAQYWIERIAGVPAHCDIASEFRYRSPVMFPGEIAVFVSQSGETADTLAALRYCRAHGVKTIGVVNVAHSTIWREADSVLPTLAGPEIGVASTKAFTAQLATLAALSIALGRARRHIDVGQEQTLSQALIGAPRLIGQALRAEENILGLAKTFEHVRDVLYLGRGADYPMALEGALKLKEISYIHAEGYAAGELKHGPIALVDELTPVVVVAPHGPLFEKTFSNMQEVAARRGRLLLISDAPGIKAAGDLPWATIEAPVCDPFIAPLVFSPALQLLAYHVAVARGTDVDQPRNLAKSVTVE